MSLPVARWREEHRRFTRLLDLLERQLDRFHYGERPDYALMLDAMRYMTCYVDACHHPREDLAFAIVAERHPRNRGEVAELIDEHATIVRAGESLVELLQEVLDDAFIAREKVEGPGQTYISGFRAHMQREERLFPRITATLRPEDWAAIDVAVPEIPDPLRSPAARDLFEALRRTLRQPRESAPLGTVA